ncbi:sugar MFS transporter [Aestuariibacter halophilus]|uniref:Sugar MFS transporter n=1 Tax=Fluctibacter halophilus TaxID=226011 RepID=A0ABS8G840_9ALTE|nr:sugar MFS transporter [Aestuariibacter halophilus]MCC2616593.1 sugar MFS transporter [Aestuariibacter halophilus]
MQTQSSPSTPPHGHKFAMTALTSLFFMWGFITALNDVLIPHLKAVFDLNYTQAMLVQFCFFGAYFLISVPAGRLVNRMGYQRGIGVGLITAAVGCLLFIPSSYTEVYVMFLGGLFVLASGITILQVAANPLVTVIGNPATASSRLTMTQAFNSLGTTVAPILGGYVLFSEHADVSADAVNMPYFVLAVVLVLIAFVFMKIQLPKPNYEAHPVDALPSGSVLKHRHLVLGALGIFLYVGAEVSIGSFLINFLGEEHIMAMPEAVAANYIAYYWGGAMVGRFIGAVLMQKIRPGLLLGVNSLLSVTLIGIAISSEGAVAMWAILAVGLCNSIMFPTIFSLALSGLGHQSSQGSGILCLAIVGGAIVPVLQGLLADSMGLQISFILPLLCYVYIGFYGIKGSQPVHQSSPATA